MVTLAGNASVRCEFPVKLDQSRDSCDRRRAFWRRAGKARQPGGDAGARREVPFVAFPQLGKFLEGGEFPQILAPKVDQELAGGFVEASVSGVVLVAGGGDELTFGRARSTPGASTRRMARLSGRRRAACRRRRPASATPPSRA